MLGVAGEGAAIATGAVDNNMVVSAKADISLFKNFILNLYCGYKSSFNVSTTLSMKTSVVK